MTRRKLTIGSKPHTSVEVRSRRGTKPAWSRTLLVSDADPERYAILNAFVESAHKGAAGLDAFMDAREALPTEPPAVVGTVMG